MAFKAKGFKPLPQPINKCGFVEPDCNQQFSSGELFAIVGWFWANMEFVKWGCIHGV